ncbi:hypothetical protein MRX96_040103 [Rhipicephalus microplus]
MEVGPTPYTSQRNGVAVAIVRVRIRGRELRQTAVYTANESPTLSLKKRSSETAAAADGPTKRGCSTDSSTLLYPLHAFLESSLTGRLPGPRRLKSATLLGAHGHVLRVPSCANASNISTSWRLFFLSSVFLVESRDSRSSAATVAKKVAAGAREFLPTRAILFQQCRGGSV